MFTGQQLHTVIQLQLTQATVFRTCYSGFHHKLMLNDTFLASATKIFHSECVHCTVTLAITVVAFSPCLVVAIFPPALTSKKVPGISAFL